MSYNITTWKTKEIRDLVIPLSALYGLSDSLVSRGWRPANPVLDLHTGIAIIDCGELSHIKGYLRDTSRDDLPDTIQVTEITFSGEASGTFFIDILIPALKKSKGELVATLVWEGGDSITSIAVSDGTVTERKVEL